MGEGHTRPPEPLYVEYSTDEIDYLKSRDARLGEYIDRIGHIERATMPDLFVALINSIVAQQISSKAFATVWGRMCAMVSPMTPEAILQLSEEQLQSCGISYRKVSYIRGAAAAIVDGTLDLDGLRMLPDAEVCAQLSSLRGIGVWSAEMLMTFSMQRPDVISKDDLAIIRGMRMVYRHRKITPELFGKYRRRYSPHATVASLYLWAVAGGACPELTDPAPMSEAQKRAKQARRRKLN